MNRTANVLFVGIMFVSWASTLHAQERIATNDTYNEFPRWKLLVNAFNVKDSGGNAVLPNHLSLGQDPKNVLHVIGGLPTSSGGCQIHYVNNDWIDRRANGFSEPFQVTSASGSTQCKPSELSVLSDGSLAVIWVEPSGGIEYIKYRTRSATGTWGSVTTGGAIRPE